MDPVRATVVCLVTCMVCGAAVAIGGMATGTGFTTSILWGMAFAASPIIVTVAVLLVVASVTIVISWF
jgi:hypothetical protein